MITKFPSGLWAVVLIASILLNGVILGVVAAGAATGLRVERGRPDFASAQPVRVFDRGLPDTVRDDIIVRLRTRAQEARPLFEEAREANAEAMRTLAAEPFDAEAARAAFARAATAREALDQHANDVTISLFSSLSPETRRQLIERQGANMMFDRRGPRFDPGREPSMRGGPMPREGGERQPPPSLPPQ